MTDRGIPYVAVEPKVLGLHQFAEAPHPDGCHSANQPTNDGQAKAKAKSERGDVSVGDLSVNNASIGCKGNQIEQAERNVKRDNGLKMITPGRWRVIKNKPKPHGYNENWARGYTWHMLVYFTPLDFMQRGRSLEDCPSNAAFVVTAAPTAASSAKNIKVKAHAPALYKPSSTASPIG